MEKIEVKLKSWNRFITRDFVVEPELLGKSHTFIFDKSTVKLNIPGLEVLDREKDKQRNKTIELTSWKADTNEPIEFRINQVDVSVTFPVTFFPCVS